MTLLPSSNVLPELGVGVVYWTELEPLLRTEQGLVDVLEIEPQTFWSETGDRTVPYRFDPDVLKSLHALSQPKLVHSVGMPVGGSLRPADQLSLLQQTISEFQVSWASEHLSFNQAEANGQAFNTGFLLPPLQTAAGVAAAVVSIQQLSRQLPVPLAIETAVSYLQPYEGELDDGEFVARIVNQADCGILLDLHNIWTNARNGRQSVENFLSQIPLERVWEVHLAGGLEYQGYWLDAHSGLVSQELYELATRIIPALPNLRALIFEILPIYLPQTGLEKVRSQLEQLHTLWDLRSRAAGWCLSLGGSNWSDASAVNVDSDSGSTNSRHGTIPECVTPVMWENALSATVTRQECAKPISQVFEQDPGIAVLQNLVGSFRAGMLVDTLKLTCRLLRLYQGEDFFWELLTTFWQQFPPELFASKEARAFADYLQSAALSVPDLPEVLAYELALLQGAISGQSTVVIFRHHPVPLLQSLQAGRLPDSLEVGCYPVEVSVSVAD